MKKLPILLLLLAFSFCMKAADAPVKAEMRSAWVATVWRLDWPSVTISSTGNQNQINRQKQDMITLLDSLHVNNMNAINFQVRDRCDAFYKSSYEPWSSDLVSERGMDPGYDPLAFVVEECHKRGMECHAWLNPYRYESQSNQWDDCEIGNYRKEHPEWIMDVGGAAILNPGIPEVTQRICDVIREIICNYDVDGVLFDDYFYLSGTPSEMDADLYNAYKKNGGTLSQGDWRRDNVNRMIHAVYTTIKAEKPWVRFGVSPAGIACTSSSVAAKHGIPACPTGSDWQYNSIYSDPVAWMKAQDLDFMSPQIYWTIGNGTDYDRATKWWSEVADKFGRHMYVSHSISSLTASSKAPGVSGNEQSLIQPFASGPNSTSFEEYANEVRLNREYTLNDAPGSIFYSCKYLYKTAPKFAHYLRTTVFNTPVLMPAMIWEHAVNPGGVKNLSRNANVLNWEGYDNMRYTVYAVPQNVAIANFAREAEYLMGVSYATTFTIPDNRLSGYNYAVCVYDRFGNEYSPMFAGIAAKDLSAPVLTYPKGGEEVEHPFVFTWNAVTDATSYIIEVSEDPAFNSVFFSTITYTNTFSSAGINNLKYNEPLYWRVRACANNYNDGVSAIESFVPATMRILSPADGDSEVSLCPVIVPSIKDRAYDIEIATESDFNEASIVVVDRCNSGNYNVAKYKLLTGTTYYARMNYKLMGTDCTSPTVAFTTVTATPPTPAIKAPVDGGHLYADQHIEINPVEGIRYARLEVCASSSFSPRASYISESINMTNWADAKAASEIAISGKNLVDGNTYYARVRARYTGAEGSADTEYSAPITFVYHAENAGIDNVTADAKAIITAGRGEIIVNASAGSVVEVAIVSAAGAQVATYSVVGTGAPQTIALHLTPGIYVATAMGDATTASVKVVVP